MVYAGVIVFVYRYRCMCTEVHRGWCSTPTVKAVPRLSENSYSPRFAVAYVLCFCVLPSPSVPLVQLLKERLIYSIVISQYLNVLSSVRVVCRWAFLACGFPQGLYAYSHTCRSCHGRSESRQDISEVAVRQCRSPRLSLRNLLL